jgi:hypothetical protein
MALEISECFATPNAIIVTFSDDLEQPSASDPSHYTIESPPGTKIPASWVDFHVVNDVAIITPKHALTVGAKVEIEAIVVAINPTRHLATVTSKAIVEDRKTRERDMARVTGALEDAVAYPMLTEEVGFAPSPLSRQSAPAGGGTSNLGQIVGKAVNDVLGWKVKPNDSKGFVGALTSSFTGQDVDGHTEWKWTPRTYAVQTDLSGGITGAQASLYSRAQKALEQSLPLLDGLYPLDPEADAEDAAALRTLVKSQFTSLVGELAMPGGPRRARVDQYFVLLLDPPGYPTASTVESDPDKIAGTLGQLRDAFGVSFSQSEYVNDVQDEQDLSNFRILADYVTSLAQSWLGNRQFFDPNGDQRFLGTQLVLLSRQLSVVAESVDEVRFTLDSVFIGPAERQTLKLNFGNGAVDALVIEDFLSWVQNFATSEGPQLIQDGGKMAVANSFLPIARKLSRLAKAVVKHRQNQTHGLSTARVQRAMQQLAIDLHALVSLADPIQRQPATEPSAAKLRAVTQTHLIAIPTTIVLRKRGGKGAVAAPGVRPARGTVTLINLGVSKLTVLKSDADVPGAVFTVTGLPILLHSGKAATLQWSFTGGANPPPSFTIATDDPQVSATVNLVQQ